LKKEIKKRILMPLFLSILLIAPVHYANAQTININVDPPHLTVDVGQTCTVTINISGVEEPGVFSYQLELHFDNTLLNITAVTYPSDNFIAKGIPAGIMVFYAPADSATIAEANTNGYINLAASPLADPETVGGRTGSGVLATVNFTGIGVGSSTLEIKEVGLLDPAGAYVTQYTVNNGVVDVVPEFTLALLVFAFLSITLVTTMLRKRIRVHNHLSHPM
jgi:hypothetical protein